jgi:hypothetical protein
LAKAIAAIEEDIQRLDQGAHPLVHCYPDLERLRQERDALIELQRRASRSGCLGSTTVIEALYPDIPVKKKTASEKAEDEQWHAIRKEAGLKIDPKTAEVEWSYGLDRDPYGICDEWELPEEFDQVGRQRWARAPQTDDIWVHFGDLPETVREELWARHGSRIAFPAGLDRLPAQRSGTLTCRFDKYPFWASGFRVQRMVVGAIFAGFPAFASSFYLTFTSEVDG